LFSLIHKNSQSLETCDTCQLTKFECISKDLLAYYQRHVILLSSFAELCPFHSLLLLYMYYPAQMKMEQFFCCFSCYTLYIISPNELTLGRSCNQTSLLFSSGAIAVLEECHTIRRCILYKHNKLLADAQDCLARCYAMTGKILFLWKYMYTVTIETGEIWI
jgi:hypothetical protein